MTTEEMLAEILAKLEEMEALWRIPPSPSSIPTHIDIAGMGTPSTARATEDPEARASSVSTKAVMASSASLIPPATFDGNFCVPFDAEDGGVDRLSRLPDLLLRNIVSRLPIKDAARTTVLSRRWNPIWRAAPLLVDHVDLAVLHLDSIHFWDLMPRLLDRLHMLLELDLSNNFLVGTADQERAVCWSTISINSKAAMISTASPVPSSPSATPWGAHPEVCLAYPKHAVVTHVKCSTHGLYQIVTTLMPVTTFWASLISTVMLLVGATITKHLHATSPTNINHRKAEQRVQCNGAWLEMGKTCIRSALAISVHMQTAARFRTRLLWWCHIEGIGLIQSNYWREVQRNYCQLFVEGTITDEQSVKMMHGWKPPWVSALVFRTLVLLISSQSLSHYPDTFSSSGESSMDSSYTLTFDPGIMLIFSGTFLSKTSTDQVMVALLPKALSREILALQKSTENFLTAVELDMLIISKCSRPHFVSLQVGCVAPHHKAADNAKPIHDAVGKAGKLLLGSNDIRNGQGCRQPKPPWLLGTEVFHSWSGKMQLIRGFMLEVSLVATFMLFTDGVLPTGGKTQRTLQKCETISSFSERSKGNFKSEHQIFYDMLVGRYSFTQSVLHNQQCCQYTVRLTLGCLLTWEMLKIQKQYDTGARPTSWRWLKQYQINASRSGAKQLKLYTVADQAFLSDLLSTIIALKESWHKITVSLEDNPLPWDTGDLEFYYGNRSNGLGTSRVLRKGECHGMGCQHSRRA